MARLPSLRSLASTLSFRLFLVLFLSVLVLFSVHMTVSRRFQTALLEEQVKADAYRASDLIRQSLLTSMLGNERERTYSMIRLIGDEPGVETIRIYNKQGEIKFSSDGREIGETVDLQAEACYVCHASARPLEAVPIEERARIYDKGGEYRVLGLINPIRNEARCSAADCHAHGPDQLVLGVLDVQMSLQALDRAVLASRERSFMVAIGIIFVSMLLMAAIVYRAVYVPTQKLHRGTEALARGELGFEIDLNRSDELGALADSFNQMARSLQKADAELRAWSHTLEDRVQQKTRELEAMHQQIVQVEKSASLGKMAATVAHELNNPLSGILTYAKLASKRVRRMGDGTDRSQVLDNLALIQSESMRCGNIVRDLLTYAREGRAVFEEARLHELVNQAVKLTSHYTEFGEVRTELKLGLENDLIACDREHIVQALIALMINAVEAMPDGGMLTIETWEPAEPESLVCLRVSDTGLGIPEDDRERIFDPFFSTKSETKGVGLGLAVVYGIVQRHGGAISMDSPPGDGAQFTIRLPRKPKVTG